MWLMEKGEIFCERHEMVVSFLEGAKRPESGRRRGEGRGSLSEAPEEGRGRS